MIKKKLSCMAVVSIFIGMGMLASCSVNDNPGITPLMRNCLNCFAHFPKD